MFGVWVFGVPDRGRGRRWGKTREGVGTGCPRYDESQGVVGWPSPQPSPTGRGGRRGGGTPGGWELSTSAVFTRALPPHRAPTRDAPTRGRRKVVRALPAPCRGYRPASECGETGGVASRLGDARGWLALTPASSAGRAPTLSHEERGNQWRSQIGVGEDEWVGLAALRPCPVGTGCPRYDESEGGPTVGWE